MLDVLCIILGVTFLSMVVVGIVYNILEASYYSATIVIGIILLLSCILSFIDETNPTAMDVYKGKTTLEITYKGGIPIDTVVVFK